MNAAGVRLCFSPGAQEVFYCPVSPNTTVAPISSHAGLTKAATQKEPFITDRVTSNILHIFTVADAFAGREGAVNGVDHTGGDVRRNSGLDAGERLEALGMHRSPKVRPCPGWRADWWMSLFLKMRSMMVAQVLAFTGLVYSLNIGESIGPTRFTMSVN